MAEIIKVAVDAMGGDYAPKEIVQGALDALNAREQVKVLLIGKKEVVEAELKGKSYPAGRLEIVDAREVIEMAEPPVNAIRTKKDSSIVRGMQMVKKGEVDAFVTAGSSGATLVGGQLLVGRVRGIERAPFAPLIPTAKGPALLVDCGANVDARPSWLVQWAQMGSIYMKNMMGIEKPRVAIVNIGAEEEKGNELVKETYPLLAELDNINFIGNIEARDVSAGAADVIVCDAFVGNVILKMYEGVASTIMHQLKDAIYSSTKAKIGGLLIKDSLKSVVKTFSTSTYGGAPMLGLRGLVVKTHGNSKAVAIEHAIEQCIDFKERDVAGQITRELTEDVHRAAPRAAKSED